MYLFHADMVRFEPAELFSNSIYEVWVKIAKKCEAF